MNTSFSIQICESEHPTVPFFCLFFKHLAYSSSPPPNCSFFVGEVLMILCCWKYRNLPNIQCYECGAEEKKRRKLNKTHNWAKRANCNRNIFECFMKRYQYPAESSHKAPQQTLTWGVMSRGLIQPQFFSQWAKACRKGEEGRQCAWIYCAALEILPQIFAFRKIRQTQ